MQAHSKMTHSDAFELNINDIMMRYNSSIEASSVYMNVTEIHLEGSARFDVSGKSDISPVSTAAGMYFNGHGTGAGHGGHGGGADLSDYKSGKLSFHSYLNTALLIWRPLSSLSIPFLNLVRGKYCSCS